MSAPSFVHLHNHTMYSLLDGALRIDEMVKVAKGWGMPALAITDHGNMFGAIEFYRKAQKAGLKPIIGCEVYVAIEGRFKRQAAWGIADGATHLVLLARNNRGYQNLMKLVSKGYLEGFYYHPRVDKELLQEHHDGLIALSGCIKGEIAHLILNGNLKKARHAAEEYNSIFGQGNFYLELQRHGIEEEEKVNQYLIQFSRELNIPIVATNDCHYLNREDAAAHDVLLCIQTGKTLEDKNRMRFQTDQVYLKSPEEMANLFVDLPEAIQSTLEIADRCNVMIEFGRLKLPRFPLPEGYQNADEYLKDLAYQGIKERYQQITPQVKDRLEHELKIIQRTGYAGYFLIVADFVRYAKSEGISVGPGRGAATSSLVSYALKITDIDPLKNNLLFERFLNPQRVNMPDIDIDFADRDRQKVINYVIKKYGKDNVCQIITFGTMAARAVIRDVGRVLGVPYGEVDKIAKLVPPGTTLERAIETVPELAQLTQSDGVGAKLISYAKTLEGLARHCSTHAAGVVITPDSLTNHTPLCTTNKKEVTTQYDWKSIEEIGLLKMDFLGLRTLTVIDDTLRMIAERSTPLKIEDIPQNDKATFDLLARGETIGVFQFESPGMRDYLRKLKPTTLDDMIAMNALYRPGPMASIDDFIRRKHGTTKITYLHPLLKPILEETYGIIVYQEQVMRIASVLAGFSLAQADMLRRAMGKKQPEIMEEQRGPFIEGCRKNGIDEETAGKIFEAMAQFAGYGFNKAHSSGYALIAYQTAYLKAHFPQEFMAANLTSEMGNSDRVAVLLDECRRMGIQVLPPDINESQAGFTVVPEGIRFGLGAIKNVGAGAIKTIVKAREKAGRFGDIFDFCERVDQRRVNKRAIESLIMAGATDSLQGHRAQLLAVLEQALEGAQTIQADRQRGQTSLFDTLNIREKKLPDIPPWSESQMLADEKKMLGFYVSGHPLEKYQQDLQAFASHRIGELSELEDGTPVVVGGIITKLKQTTDRKGKPMAFATLEDFSGSTEALVFSDTYEKFRPLVVADQMVMAEGRLSIQDRETEKAKVVVTRLLPLAKVRSEYAKAVNIAVSGIGLEEEPLRELRILLEEYPGKCQVVIHLEGNSGGKFIIRSRSLSVSASDKLLAKLRNTSIVEKIWLE
ncbi:MAG: DNA polymerase III subunit alpha [Candidatus Latescibacterota bacterium]|nr:MAG: DNA polymerase III subunit alpha [Candidatus Latescibacterota bacterium]